MRKSMKLYVCVNIHVCMHVHVCICMYIYCVYVYVWCVCTCVCMRMQCIHSPVHVHPEVRGGVGWYSYNTLRLGFWARISLWIWRLLFGKVDWPRASGISTPQCWGHRHLQLHCLTFTGCWRFELSSFKLKFPCWHARAFTSWTISPAPSLILYLKEMLAHLELRKPPVSILLCSSGTLSFPGKDKYMYLKSIFQMPSLGLGACGGGGGASTCVFCLLKKQSYYLYVTFDPSAPPTEPIPHNLNVRENVLFSVTLISIKI